MRHLLIDPQLPGDITQVKTTVHTLYGKVTVAYDKAAGTLQVQVPDGCDAKLVP